MVDDIEVSDECVVLLDQIFVDRTDEDLQERINSVGGAEYGV